MTEREIFMKRIITLIASIVLAGVLCGGVLVGCASSTQSGVLTEAQEENRAYMQEVNQVMAGFNLLCTDFALALENNDADQVEKDTQNIAENLETLKGLEVPEALTDVHEAYVEGAEKLVAALTDYLALSQSDADVTSQAYAEQLAKIQAEYDEGVAALKAGDDAAAAKE